MNNQLLPGQRDELINVLKARFTQNMVRHRDVDWVEISDKLEASPSKLWSLYEMERTGGEPDVVAADEGKGQYIFYDCAAESPIGRRSLCYDDDALRSRKENKPVNSAVEMADEMGITLLTEEQYRYLQQLGRFDLKTSSWVVTPPAIRKLGGAVFCDRRYDTVFFFHNGADSYYAARGFRGALTI